MCIYEYTRISLNYKISSVIEHVQKPMAVGSVCLFAFLGLFQG